MPQSLFSRQTFDPDTLQVLYAAFDAVWKQVEPSVGPGRSQHVRDAIADALMGMATAGQCDPAQLEAYALDQGRKALSV